ncbi:MAG: hypothetical protein BV459_00205 [Thermoplasmata archaeon M11B2D]|nr:MAG: hypothetical protein BV459_00205 [Thermoplasmata archaeon M11B2D]
MTTPTLPKKFSPRPELLLHPNIPKPMHGLNPRTVMGKSWWDDKRQTAYRKTGYRCAACGIHKSDAKYYQRLEAHEFYSFDYQRGRMELIEIVALCHSCHMFIHSGLLAIQHETGEIPKKKYDDIIAHGETILELADDASVENYHQLKANIVEYAETGKLARWSDWRLIIDGVEYEGKFKNIREWENYYAR